MKITFKIVVIAFFAGFAGAFTFHHFVDQPNQDIQAESQFNQIKFDSPASNQIRSSGSVPNPPTNLAPVDFSEAATKAIPSVVYINSISEGVTLSLIHI